MLSSLSALPQCVYMCDCLSIGATKPGGIISDALCFLFLQNVLKLTSLLQIFFLSCCNTVSCSLAFFLLLLGCTALEHLRIWLDRAAWHAETVLFTMAPKLSQLRSTEGEGEIISC